MRITSLFSIEIKLLLRKWKPGETKCMTGQAVCVNCLRNVQEFRVGVVPCAVVHITFIRATNRCYGYVKLMHLMSKMGRQKFLDVGCYLM